MHHKLCFCEFCSVIGGDFGSDKRNCFSFLLHMPARKENPNFWLIPKNWSSRWLKRHSRRDRIVRSARQQHLPVWTANRRVEYPRCSCYPLWADDYSRTPISNLYSANAVRTIKRTTVNSILQEAALLCIHNNISYLSKMPCVVHAINTLKLSLSSDA